MGSRHSQVHWYCEIIYSLKYSSLEIKLVLTVRNKLSPSRSVVTFSSHTRKQMALGIFALVPTQRGYVYIYKSIALFEDHFSKRLPRDKRGPASQNQQQVHGRFCHLLETPLVGTFGPSSWIQVAHCELNSQSLPLLMLLNYTRHYIHAVDAVFK